MASTSQAPAMNLDRVLGERISWRYKALPPGKATTIRSVGSRGWNVLGGEFMLPVMVLKDSALRHNSKLMAAYCKHHEILLAPHGKTTMAPQLVKRQLDDGAWAGTAATMSQVRVWRAFGVDRIILANELVEHASVRWIANELAGDPAFEFFCLVDSLAEVDLLESALAGSKLDRRLQVLLEVGPEGGRTGCRTHEQALDVGRAVAGSKSLALAGVEAFEGVIHAESLGGTLAAVDRFLEDMHDLIVELDGADTFSQVPDVIVTAGGSAFPDRVVAEMETPWALSRPVRLVLRSGCYLT